MVLSFENGGDFDRARELRAFDESKAGVKGLVDSGVERVPLIFNRTWIGFTDQDTDPTTDESPHSIPVIDLRCIHMDPAWRSEIVRDVQDASRRWGFFQVVNHGIPESLLDEMLEGVRRFHEQDTQLKKAFYTRDRSKKVLYMSNFDLFSAPTANWRDTLYVTASDPSDREELPEVCRDILIGYSARVRQLAYTLLELISEALGLKPSYLKEMECAEKMLILGHYYPSCREPELTMGTTIHADNDFLTILLQDHIGGLEVLYENQWVEVVPLQGALIVNIGDLLHVLSNDKFISVNHRVLSKSEGPRISVASFFRAQDMMGNASRFYGPIPELISEENPPVYRNIDLKEYMDYYIGKGLNGTSALTPFRI
ncbi:1-aminocyclopropane-1-carboxylate oxidase homolog 1-like isoform X1 [Punica granatum]|uniref:1-aminocyclopropane-1-carboxylate oxidase homolog 1-like isoform X1 n=2 Tax=Punica granatum TaxID=22663 RepID=A0A6P8BS32_PUNGR|nr:1-aminocyclopropane-1-carboxylate oxidase homolog 1-like isoform X1 [Punica granatum]